MHRSISATLVVLLAATPLSAQTDVEKAAKNETSAFLAWQNEKVCETIVVTGSRLGKRKVCATRAEWAERRKDDRETIERTQAMPCVVGNSGGNTQTCGTN